MNQEKQPNTNSHTSGNTEQVGSRQNSEMPEYLLNFSQKKIQERRTLPSNILRSLSKSAINAK